MSLGIRSVQQAQNDISVRYRCRQPSFCSMRLLRVLLLPLDGMLLYHSECDPDP